MRGASSAGRGEDTLPTLEAVGTLQSYGPGPGPARIATFLTIGDVTRVDWSVLLVLGILVGSFVAAKLSGEFRWRVPEVQIMLRSAVGGIAMGIGAALAGGCTIGSSLVATSLFSDQSWVPLIAIMAGTWGAAWFFLQHPQRAAAASRPAPVRTPVP